jgi:hypothetical protein
LRAIRAINQSSIDIEAEFLSVGNKVASEPVGNSLLKFLKKNRK